MSHPRPLIKRDEIGIDLSRSLQNTVDRATILSELNKEIEKENKSEYIWVKEGKKMTRKKIVV